MKLARLGLLLAVATFGLVTFQSAHATDADEIKICLDHWGKTPFGDKPEFRVVGGKVKVMGIGGNIDESKKTEKPELVLLRPAVTVMAKTVIDLRNPNGWYCLKGETAVMGKMQINLDCHAHMASSTSGATVMGEDQSNSGTTVMGSTVVTRVGDCPAAHGAADKSAAKKL